MSNYLGSIKTVYLNSKKKRKKRRRRKNIKQSVAPPSPPKTTTTTTKNPLKYVTHVNKWHAVFNKIKLTTFTL